MPNSQEVLERWSEMTSSMCMGCRWLNQHNACMIPGGVCEGRTISGIPGMTVKILLGNIMPHLRETEEENGG